MKKLLSLVLFAAMLVSVCGFTFGAVEDTTTTTTAADSATYYITSWESDGNSMDADALANAGISYYVTMAADGTGTMVTDSEAPFTWDDSYFYDETGASLPYALDGDTLTLTLPNGTIVFTLGEPAEGAPAGASAAAAGNAAGTITTYRGDVYVEIVGAELFIDTNEKDAIRFYYDVTNLTDSVIYPGYVDTEAEQFGFELVSTYAYYNEEVPEEDNSYLDMEPGITLRCVAEYNCNLSAGGEVTFTLSDYGDYPVTATYDLANLPGRPAEDLTIEPITDPTFFAGAEESLVSDDFTISIDSAEVVEASRNSSVDYVLRVYYTYTNNSGEESSVGSGCTLQVFQDGVELNTDYARYEIDEDDYWYDDMDDGATVSFSRCYAIRSDSPVEIVVSDWDGYYAAVITPIM